MCVIFALQVSNHIEDYCPLTKIPCPYAWMGCRTEVKYYGLDKYIHTLLARSQEAFQPHYDWGIPDLYISRSPRERIKWLCFFLEYWLGNRLKWWKLNDFFLSLAIPSSATDNEFYIILTIKMKLVLILLFLMLLSLWKMRTSIFRFSVLYLHIYLFFEPTEL